MAGKLTGLQRYVDSASSTDAGDSDVTSWQKALLFGLVGASYEAHKLTHEVAVVVWRPEGVLCNSPPWREDHKVCHCCACTSAILFYQQQQQQQQQQQWQQKGAAAEWQQQYISEQQHNLSLIEGCQNRSGAMTCWGGVPCCIWLKHGADNEHIGCNTV